MVRHRHAAAAARAVRTFRIPRIVVPAGLSGFHAARMD